MKMFLLMLVMLGGAFWFWNYNEGNGSGLKGMFNNLFEEKQDVYVVQKGDTLSSISRRYGLSVEDLKSRNQLSSDVIHVGMQLKVDGGNVTQGQASEYVGPLPRKSAGEVVEAPKPKPVKPIAKKQLPKSTVMESQEIAIDIDDKNQVYLKTNDGKYKPAGVIIYGSDADKNGNEVKTITYRDLKGKETTLSGANTPDAVIRKSLGQ